MFRSLLRKLGSGFAQAGVSYMVIGGQAVARYGEPRLTKDIDITLGVDAGELERMLAIIRSLGLQPATDDPAGFVKQTNVLPVIEGQSGIRVDLIFSFSPYERKAIMRSLPVKVHDQTVQYASPEDLIIHKMVAGRPRDLDDVRGILARNRNLDTPYIESWLKSFEQTLGTQLVAGFLHLRNEVV